MKALINNLITIFQNAITAGSISAVSVQKGLENDPSLVGINRYPYIALDDSGERVEDVSSTAQNRIYSVMIEIAVYSLTRETSLDLLLDVCNQVKTVLELAANRQKDSHRWGISITPFNWEDDKYFFRGRQIIVDFIELEDKYFDY